MTKDEYTLASGWTKLVYMPDGSFSLTRITMLVISLSCILVAWISIFAGLKGIALPSTIYTYLLGITGGSMVQYGYTKYNSPDTISGNNYKHQKSSSKLNRAIDMLFYMPDGTLSATRIVMILSLITAGIVVWIGISAFIIPYCFGKTPIELPESTYTFIGSLCGEGIAQYIGGKQLSAIASKKSDAN